MVLGRGMGAQDEGLEDLGVTRTRDRGTTILGVSCGCEWVLIYWEWEEPEMSWDEGWVPRSRDSSVLRCVMDAQDRD